MLTSTVPRLWILQQQVPVTAKSSAIHTKIRKEDKVNQQTGWRAGVDSTVCGQT